MVAWRMPAMAFALPAAESGAMPANVKQLRIVHNFGPLWIGEPIRPSRASVLFSASLAMNAPYPGFGRNFDAEHMRAEALVVGIFGIKRKPNGRFLAARE